MINVKTKHLNLLSQSCFHTLPEFEEIDSQEQGCVLQYYIFSGLSTLLSARVAKTVSLHFLKILFRFIATIRASLAPRNALFWVKVKVKLEEIAR